MNKRQILQTLGPGILFASTAIGVSHLVQSTRAGALAGWGLLWAVALANVAKYPFFEFGSRYASATGQSLIQGYRQMGRWAAWSFLLLTLLTCFFVLGAVGLVTAAFLDDLMGISSQTQTQATPAVAVAVMLGSAILLMLGAYRGLDRFIKVLAVVLLLSTCVAFFAAAGQTAPWDVPRPSEDFNPWNGAGLAFLIALVGWMPSAVDMSTWNSIWTLERIRETGYRPTLKQTLREFNLGYWMSALLALFFMGLGAMILFVKQIELPEGTAAFAAGIVELYTSALGGWSRPFVAASAFSAMLGTIVACLDGYTRSLSASFQTLFEDKDFAKSKWLVLLLAAGSLGLILGFPDDIRTLVDIATTLSFLVAPLVAAANWHLVTRSSFPTEARPPHWLMALSGVGMLFLVGFGLLFLRTLSDL
ncbi:MAG: Nramp family divalent metal transporter [Flavobacteriales bacterium]